VTLLLDAQTAATLSTAERRAFVLRLDTRFPVDADRRVASFASWYELFPRSQGALSEDHHGTFDDVIARMPAIRDMGFDVLYFPPIHPIGRSHRKGRNNSLVAAEGDPGSPYAIGSSEGGHDAIHPQLGTFEDFARMIEAATANGLEIALDFAIQCSPDHPWLREHPEWFQWRADGTVRHAENPPKKYEDIVNLDFYPGGDFGSPAAPALWLALRDIVLFWIEHGVRIFRVDNPHTKPLSFWQWMISEVRGHHPDVIFLAEAFTRPKVMARLAKIGYSQSYTYFTWRESKWDLTQYLEELNAAPLRDFFRPHFFVNTPDINPRFLQKSGRPGFVIRAALAGFLSGLWGMYSGFELCEATAVTGKEDYLDSEKYQIKVRSWQQPGNIVPEVTLINRIRRLCPALHSHLGLKFQRADNEQILFFTKSHKDAPDKDPDDIVLVAINLDAFNIQEGYAEFPLWDWGLPDDGEFAVEDMVTGNRWVSRGKHQTLSLDPAALPFLVWRITPNRAPPPSGPTANA
jgi:starch synthase (maltosyl-transferring)